jgi:TolB protein
MHQPSRTPRPLRLILAGLAVPLSGCGIFGETRCDFDDDDVDICFPGVTNPVEDTVGTINVTVHATGVGGSAAAFAVTVGTVTRQTTPPSGFIGFQNLTPGTYSVSVAVPPNCLILPPQFVSVGLSAGEIENVTLNVDCVANVGHLRVSTTTLGNVSDPDAYRLEIDGQPSAFGLNATATFLDIPVGEVVVFLGSVEQGCFVVGADPRTVEIVFATQTVVDFTIDCTGQNGILRVVTSTTGFNLDSDGYFVLVGSQNIGFLRNYTYDFEPLAVGDHLVTLSNVAPNCAVAGQNPRTVTVVANTVTQTIFDIACGGPPPMILFESDREGDLEIYRANPDGTGLGKLTVNDAPHDDEDPSWSWDNQKVTFRSDRSGESEIWTMNADGSNPQQITNSQVDDHNPAFSPDGSKIVYDSGDEDDGSLEIEIYDAVGRTFRRLTDALGVSRNPSFNPGGTRILFESNRDGDFDLYLMDPDGGNVEQLVNAPGDDVDGAWSPDGTMVVYANQSGVGASDLWLVNAAGTIRTPFMVNLVSDRQPSFSPDGDQVVFTSDRDGSPDLFRVNVDGSGLIKVGSSGSQIDEDAEYSKRVP